ncbi:hypothetical protein AB0E83_04925 [Streptomyces sp. NPDC035033]|uniref:hypothetical protein n=1 Tax=Streptomyces sp. NPDC035033 TaxID=3155368 RepID=UPI0033EB79F2
MTITAQLLGSVRLPGGADLVDGPHREAGPGGLALRRADRLEVHRVPALFSRAPEPAAVFPAPWPGWDRGVDAVAPDLDFAVFSGQRAVRAVAADGRALWEYRHGCWGPVIGHPHTGDDQEVCSGLEHGSVLVSADGRLVWAHVVGEDGLERWVVLDARDGSEIGRIPLEDSVAAGSHQRALPDGETVLLCVGMGQDGVLLYAGRRDGEAVAVRDLGEGLDRILLDVHPALPRCLTVEHGCHDLQLHAPDGTVLAERDAEGLGDGRRWDFAAGFAGPDAVVAVAETAGGEDGPGHWLLDGDLRPLGPVAYPSRVTGCVRPLGDGTWLTHDRATDTLSRWTRAAP